MAKCWAPLYLEQMKENIAKGRFAFLVTQDRRESAGGQELGMRSPALSVSKQYVQSIQENQGGTFS